MASSDAPAPSVASVFAADRSSVERTVDVGTWRPLSDERAAQLDTSDPVQRYEYQADRVMKTELHYAELRRAHDELKWCYRREGVNHHVKCKDLAKAYLALLDRTSAS